MFRIGEFSKLTQVSIRMLRYYDEVGLLKPAKVDEWTGHRLYSVEQMPRLNKILYLRDSGFNVSEIALAISLDDSLLLDILDKKRSEIEQNIQNEQEKLKRIALAKAEIEGNKGELHYNIVLKPIPAYQVLSLRKIVPTYYAEGNLWKELSVYAKEQNIEISDYTFSIYHDTEYEEQDVDIELCVPVNKMGKAMAPFCFRTTEPVHTMACTMVYGDFSNIKGGYIAFARWLQENSRYRIAGATRQIVHRGPWNETEPDRYLTEIQIPVVE